MSSRQGIPDDTKMCNCAGCSRPLLAASERDRVAKSPPASPLRKLRFVARRVNGRPYCVDCGPEPPKWLYRGANGHA